MLIENKMHHAEAGHACHACGARAPVADSLVDTARAFLEDPTEANVESALRILLELEEPSWVEQTPKVHLALLDVALAAPVMSSSLRAQALVARGRVAWRAGRIETSESDLEHALELAVVLGDRVTESLAKRFLAHVRLLRGRLDDARTLASDARAIAVSLSDRRLEALAVSVLGYEARLRGEPRAARELLESAIAGFMGVDDGRFDGALRVDVVFTYLDDGDFSTAARYAERMLGGSSLAPVNRARLEICLGHTALMSGDATLAEARYGRARDAARRVGDFARELCAIACIAVALFEQGRPLDARVELLDLLPAARRFGNNLYSCLFAILTAIVECTLANYHDARAIIDRARHDASASIGPGEIGLALCDRLVELCESRASVSERNATLAAWARDVSQMVPSIDSSGAPWLIEGRILFRLLSTAVATRLPTVPPRRALRVHASGRWFELDGERVHCGGRRVMRRLLLALAEARLATPARQLTATVLIEHGWPGERMSADSGRNRLHVMLTRMRNLGLRGALEGDDSGYSFADSLDVELVDATTC